MNELGQLLQVAVPDDQADYKCSQQFAGQNDNQSDPENLSSEVNRSYRTEHACHADRQLQKIECLGEAGNPFVSACLVALRDNRLAKNQVFFNLFVFCERIATNFFKFIGLVRHKVHIAIIVGFRYLDLILHVFGD